MAGGAQGKSGIKVFLLDDHEIVRRGVRDMLEAEPDIIVVGEAGTAESALARIPALRPDVAVLDVRLPDGDGVSVCREIRSRMPEIACLMLTSFGDDEALFDAIMAGAAGYVLKQIRGTDLVGAVRTVASGESMLDPEAASRVMARMRDQAIRKDPLAGLTNQEWLATAMFGDVPTLFRTGRVNKPRARQLIPHFPDICMATAATPTPTASDTASASHRADPPARPPGPRPSPERADSIRGRRGA
jgi:DNA-binding NarL/FixJ family response regulator